MQSRTPRGMTIIVLWMAMLASTPQVDINATFASSQVQKIIPPDPIPVAFPSNLIRATIEYAEFFYCCTQQGRSRKTFSHLYNT
jgi:hypothetical protein